eukprot:911574-Amphidinium_carterae.1
MHQGTAILRNLDCCQDYLAITSAALGSITQGEAIPPDSCQNYLVITSAALGSITQGKTILLNSCKDDLVIASAPLGTYCKANPFCWTAARTIL